VTPGVSGLLFEASRAHFVEAISAERYIAWLYESSSGPNAVIGGVGIQLRELAPHPDRTGQHVPSGPAPKAAELTEGPAIVILATYRASALGAGGLPMRRRFWLASSLHGVREAAVAYGPERFCQSLHTRADKARFERAEAQEHARSGQMSQGEP